MEEFWEWTVISRILPERVNQWSSSTIKVSVFLMSFCVTQVPDIHCVCFIRDLLGKNLQCNVQNVHNGLQQNIQHAEYCT